MQAKNKKFTDLIAAAEINQTELAQILGLTPAAVSRWHKIGIPQYATAYLELRAEYLALKKQTGK